MNCSITSLLARRWVRWCGAAALVLLAATTAWAQAATGTVLGRVSDDATALSLGGALVRVEGTALQTYSDDSGSFTLFNVPAGEQSLRFAYVGYDDLVVTANVAANGITRVEAVFQLEEVITLDTLIVEGALVGTARALNQQRAANRLTNIVAADEIGNFPDQNAAESLQRVPGLALYRDQGEGRYVVVRGLNYTFTSVELDGTTFAGADLGERATALDVVSTDLLSAVEVTKAMTPDQDAEGLAGKVNIKTRSPFDSDGFDANLRAQALYSHLTEAWGYKVNGEVSWLSQDKRWGFLVAPSYQVRKFGSYNYETGGAWSEETSPTDGQDYYFNEEVDFREYEIERTRIGLSGTIEFRPDDATNFYLRSTYNSFVDEEYRWVTRIPFAEGTITQLDAQSATVTSMRRISRRLRQREKDQEVYGAVLGGEKVFGNWTVDAALSFSQGTEERPDETAVNFRRSTRDGTFSYSFTNPYDFTVTQTAGASLFDPASYNQLSAVEITNETGEETAYDLGVNARLDLKLSVPAYLKFGVRGKTREKSSEAEVVEYTGTVTGFTFSALAQGIGEYPFLRVAQINPDAQNSVFAANRSSFSSERLLEDSTLDDWTSNEDILAVYAMAGATFSKLNVIAGVRYERTEFTTGGFDVDLDAETVTARSRSHDYDNLLPGVHLRYDLTDKLVARASWTNSIARPDFSQTAYFRAINHSDEEITVGNPGLETLESQNWDASIEYYLPSLGVLSASVFYKEIENFSFESELPGGDPAFPGYEVTTFLNGADGEISGLELAYQQQLRFLPGALSGFGVLANITFLDSEASYPTRPGEAVPFIGQSDYVGNLGLTYEYKGFFVRAALNFRGERLREDEPVGDSEFTDLIVDDFRQVDLTFRYEPTKQWTLFAELINVTDEPFRVFQRSPGGTTRLGQFEEYGWSANFGARWEF